LTAFAPDDDTVDLGPAKGYRRHEWREHGLKLRVLVSPTNNHTPRYEWPMKSVQPEVAADWLAKSHEARPWDVVDMHYVPEASPTHLCIRKLPEYGWPVEVQACYSAPILDLALSEEQYFGQRSKKLKKELRHHENRLRSLGTLEMCDVIQNDDWESWFDKALEVERSSWKGNQGSAISQHREERDFYSNVFREARKYRRSKLFVLLLDGEVIAFSTLILVDRTYYGIKNGYAQKVSKYGPGTVLMGMIVRSLLQNGHADKLDMLSPASEWKMRWATGTESQLWVRIYGPGVRSRFIYNGRRVAGKILTRWPRLNVWRKKLLRKEC
jgi:hypothetical protein